MTAGLWLLLLLAAVGAFWYRGLEALERARNTARGACRRAGVQFLDESVVRERLWVQRDHRGRMVLARRYRFEFASRGDHRYRGTVTVHGRRVAGLDMEPWADEPPAAPPKGEAQ